MSLTFSLENRATISTTRVYNIIIYHIFFFKTDYKHRTKLIYSVNNALRRELLVCNIQIMRTG